MPPAHQRRFRQFLKQLKAGEISGHRSARRREPRPAAPASRSEEAPEAFDDKLPLIPVA